MTRPTFRLVLSLLSLFVVFSFFSTVARAGYYVGPVYSGGTCTLTELVGDSPPPMPYSLYNGYWGNSGEASGSAECSGAVTAAFYWIPDGPDDDPPQSAIVTIESQGYWSVDGNFEGADGEAKNGQDDPENIYINPGGEWGFGNSQGTHYKIKGGAEFSVTINPSAHVSEGDNNIAGVFVKVGVTPVIIGLPGVLYDENYKANILVGQGCSAEINIAPFTISNYQWQVSGTKLWGMYLSGDQKTGGPTPVDPSNWTSNSPFWYWEYGAEFGKNETVTFSGNAFYTDGSGQSQAIGAVSAIRKVSVWRPYVGIDGITLGATGVTGSDITSETISGGASTSSGFDIFGAVGTPALFSENEGYGVWGWLQLCSLNRVHDPGSTTNTGGYVLDSAFPYNMVASAGDTPGTPNDANSTDQRHRPALFSDSPSTPYTYATSHVSVHDNFKLHIMYLPPDNGRGTIWVPLLKVIWDWSADTSRTFGFGGWSPFSPDPPGSVHYGGFVLDPDYPQWADRFLSH